MQRIYPKVFELDARVPGMRVLVGDPPEGAVGDCPNCGGRQVMYAFYVSGGPFKFPPDGRGDSLKYVDGNWFTGETKAQPCPVCNGNQYAEYLQRICGLEGQDLDIRLDWFKFLPGKEKARELAGELLSQVPRPHGVVTFHGGYGAGKTMLLKALVNGYRTAGIAAVYTRMADLLANVREGFGDHAKNAAEAILSKYSNVQVLAIDEFDRVKLSDWALETMFRLLDGRYEQQHAKMTLLATNTDPYRLPPELAYLSSRLSAGTICEVAGGDVRQSLGTNLRQGAML